MSTSTSTSTSDKPQPQTTTLETKSLLPQHTRPRNILTHSPKKSTTTIPLPLPNHHTPPPHPHTHSNRRIPFILISTLFISTTLLTLLTLFTKFIIFPYLLPTPSPSLRILSLSLNSSSPPSILSTISISNPTLTSTFHFSDSAYTLHYNSKPISETNPSLKIQIPPKESVEINYEMLLEKNEDVMMVYRARRGETVLLDMTVYLYGSSEIRPWSLRMVALFYDCIGIRVGVDLTAVDGDGGVACQLVEKLTS